MSCTINFCQPVFGSLRVTGAPLVLSLLGNASAARPPLYVSIWSRLTPPDSFIHASHDAILRDLLCPRSYRPALDFPPAPGLHLSEFNRVTAVMNSSPVLPVILVYILSKRLNHVWARQTLLCFLIVFHFSPPLELDLETSREITQQISSIGNVLFFNLCFDS